MIENRRALRFNCDERLICKVAGEEFNATVIDISRGGMKVQCEKRLQVGSKLFLRLEDSVRGRAPVKAIVRWVLLGDQFEVGLEFQDSASKLSRRWVRKLFPDAGAAWTAGHQQRTEVRAPVRLPVVSANGFVEGTTIDVSGSGAYIELPQKLDDTVGLFLCLPWSYLEVRANVLRAEMRDGKWFHSVQFAALRDEQKDAIDAFVESRALGN